MPRWYGVCKCRHVTALCAGCIVSRSQIQQQYCHGPLARLYQDTAATGKAYHLATDFLADGRCVHHGHLYNVQRY